MLVDASPSEVSEFDRSVRSSWPVFGVATRVITEKPFQVSSNVE
jgi:hypothetical protein